VALLSGALADRARVVRSVQVGPRVEGRTDTQETSFDWQPARLVPDPSGREAEENGQRVIHQTARLVLADADVLTTDVIEVQSATAGAGRWEVVGVPEVVATRRLGRAVVVAVARTVEPPPAEDVG
jgi:hypothetical protein